MRLFYVAAVLLGLTLLWRTPARAQETAANADLAANAAVQYWQAFAHLPTLDEAQEKALSEWSTVSLDDPAVQKLLADSRHSLMYLHRGAKLPQCDWGLDFNDGISLLMPHLARARELARLAALHGRYEFERGSAKLGRADAAAITALGRHAGRDPVMICVLVRYLIEGLAVDLAAPYAPDLNTSYAAAAARFKELPSAPVVRDTLAAEKKLFLDWVIKKMQEEEARKPGAGLVLWQNLLSGGDAPEALTRIADVKECIRFLEGVGPVYDELEKLLALPKAEFDRRYPAFKAKIEAENVLASQYVPAVDQLLAKEQRHQARLAMLMAALAVIEDGPDKLKDIPDPFGDGPFEHRALDKGFELKSKLIFEGQPVTLTVGHRARD
jgi:hypothetical protein